MKKFYKKLVAINIIALFFLFSASGEPILPILKGTRLADVLYILSAPNTILFNISIGIIVSSFFWIIVVAIPESQKKNNLKLHLIYNYEELKMNCAQVLVWAKGERMSAKGLLHLTNPDRFRQYFSKEDWYAIANSLENNPYYCQELSKYLSRFIDEFNYISNTVGHLSTSNPSAHRHTLSVLNEMKYQSNNIHQEIKPFMRNLWSMFTHWELQAGQSDEDFITKAINEI